MIKGLPVVEYKYNEKQIIQDIIEHIDSTYTKHYGSGSIQTTEFTIDAGHGEGFCIGNIIKYAQRYGKKNGYNKEDILKIIHYAIILYYIHENEEKRLRKIN
jgi:hypothetical protein